MIMCEKDTWWHSRGQLAPLSQGHTQVGMLSVRTSVCLLIGTRLGANREGAAARNSTPG